MSQRGDAPTINDPVKQRSEDVVTVTNSPSCYIRLIREVCVDEEGIGFEIIAASLKADASDVSAFLPALATKLQGALPEQTSIHHAGGLFSHGKTIQAIDVDLGDQRFHIEELHGRLEASRQKSVRGIVLKNESLQVDHWIEALSEALTVAAASSETSRNALKQMLEDA